MISAIRCKTIGHVVGFGMHFISIPVMAEPFFIEYTFTG